MGILCGVILTIVIGVFLFVKEAYDFWSHR